MNQITHVLGRVSIATRASALAISLALAACGGGGYGGGGGSTVPAPTVSLSIQPTTVSLGQSAVLTWSSSAGSSCTASDGWSGGEANSGTQTVAPTSVGSTIYTLKCMSAGGGYGGGGGNATTKSATLTVTAASAFATTALVSDSGVNSLAKDTNLVNPWGIAFGSTTPLWVANNHTGTSTVHDGNGVAQPVGGPLVVALPAGPAAVTFGATGIVHNPSTTGFVITSGVKSATAVFIFAGESGKIGGWSAAVDPANVVTMYADSSGAVYKGLSLAQHGAANYLYATDFHNGKVDVFDAAFIKQTPSANVFSFTDPTLPTGYAPFGIQAISDGPGGSAQLYVSYAQQALPDKHDNTSGAGLGIVNVFDTNGALVSHLVAAGGALNAPWGIALAPSDFGTLSRTVLVGNFGDGKINAFDPSSGRLIGTVANSAGATFAVPGLWGIAFGNDAHNQPHNTLFYAAGTHDGANGEFGRIDLGATAPVLNAPPVVALTAPAGSVRGVVALTASATDVLGISKVQFFVNGSSLGFVATPPYAAPWDTTTVPDGTATLLAKATDPDGNVGLSAPVMVTVANNAVATTLTQIQTDVFTPICSGCHSGSSPTSGPLPGSQNLTAGHSLANLVSVASHEQPGLLRVKPGDPANSYLIQKLEGAASITGQRMPLGGPYLDQATIDKIKSWIAAGATNN